MAWVKRNIFFVISVAVGLLLTGYCGYLLYNALSENAAVSDDYQTTLSSLQALEQKSPYPSVENIKAAKQDEQRVKTFMEDFRKRFAPYPAPAVVDERGFKTYLDDTLVRFRTGAEAAEVGLPPDFGFGFADLTGRLTYPLGNIEPWMEQMEEIESLLNILYTAKINYLAGLSRVPISTDDAGAGLAATSVTNQWGVVTPYKITFRGFSAEIASVLEGFAKSSHCFIIKSLVVVQDTSVQPMMIPTTPGAPAMSYVPRQRYGGNPFDDANRMRGRGEPPAYRRPMPPPVAMAPAANPFAAPVTILSEGPLLVTIAVDVVKLKAEH